MYFYSDYCKYLLKLIILSIIFILFNTIMPQAADNKIITPVPGISYTPLKQVVPGPGLPDGLNLRRSNCNLDLTQYNGRYFFAWRNAPTHFASTKTRLIIVSSTDRETWGIEKIIHKGRDIREPRFMVYKDRLFFYFYTVGKYPWTFSPQHIWMSEYKGAKNWTEPAKIWKPNYVVWRAKEHNGQALMSVYTVRSLIDADGVARAEQSLLKSDDGINWDYYDPAKPVQTFAGSEADFEFDSAGNLYTVVRNEAGMSKICKAPASNLADFSCTETPFKYDSPIMFKHDGVIYLIGRHNMDGDGTFYRDVKYLKRDFKSAYLLLKYWITPKRTAMYRFNTLDMKIEWLFDFPSRGDTSFPALTKISDNQYLLFNYSSPIDGPDMPWLRGQLNKTRIYSTVITFSGH